MFRISRLLLVLVPLCVRTAGMSQGVVSHLTTADGLSQGMITSLVQDKDGFVWAGTMDGLNRFDGYGFKTYRFDPSKNSISGNQINSLLEDTRGLLWIGIDHGGLNCYDKKKGRFIDLSSKMPPHFKDGIGIVKIFEVDPGVSY